MSTGVKVNYKTMVSYTTIQTLANNGAHDFEIDANGKFTYLDEDGVEHVVMSKDISTGKEYAMNKCTGIVGTKADSIVIVSSLKVVNGSDMKFTIAGMSESILVKDYFKKNGSHPFRYFGSSMNLSIGWVADIDIVEDGWLKNLNLYDAYNLTEGHYGTKFTTNTITGTVFNDKVDLLHKIDSAEVYEADEYIDKKGKQIQRFTINTGKGNDAITGSSLSDVINAGDGNDTVYATKGNDTITTGKGTNEIDYSNVKTTDFGTDTIKLTKGEELRIAFEGAQLYTDGKDAWAATGNTKGKALIKDYAKGRQPVATVKLNGNNDISDLAFIVNADDEAVKSYKGSRLNENIYTNAKDQTITGAGGDNVVIIDASKSFGTKTINLTNGENLNIALTNTEDYISDFMNHCVTSVKDKNFIITVYKDTARKEEQGKIILKNFAKTNVIGEDGSLKIKLYEGDYYNKTTFAAATIDLIESTLKIGVGEPVHKPLLEYYGADESKGLLPTNWDGVTSIINGTRLDEKFNVSAYASKDGKKGVTINAGDGVNVITGSNYNDTIKAGDGNDTYVGSNGDNVITLGAGSNYIDYTNTAISCDDHINLTKGETLYIDPGIITVKTPWERKASNIKWGGYTDGKNVKFLFDYDEDSGSYLNSFTINNYAKGARSAYVEVNFGPDHEHIDIDTISYTVEYTGKNSYTGSRLNEQIEWDDKYIGSDKKNLYINAGDGNNTIYGASGNDIIIAGSGFDHVFGSKGNDTYTLGAGTNSIDYNDSDEGDDIINLTKNETLKISNWSGLYDFEKVGNDIIVTRMQNETHKIGTTTLKNLGKDNDLANVSFWLSKLGDVDIFGQNEDNRIKVNAEKGGTITGTKGLDRIVLGTKAATIVESDVPEPSSAYDPIRPCFDHVENVDTAKKVTFKVKDGIDFDTVGMDLGSVGEDPNRIYINKTLFYYKDISEVDLTVKDGKNSYKFAAGSLLVDDDKEINLTSANNNLLLIDNIDESLDPVKVNVTDGKKNDVIIGCNDAENTFNYQYGGSDMYMGGQSSDIYNVDLWSKNTSLVISDKGNSISAKDPKSPNNVLNLNTCGDDLGKIDGCKFFIDVDVNGKACGDGDLFILNNRICTSATAFKKALENNKGTVLVEDYLKTGVKYDNENTKLAEEHGEGYIQTINMTGTGETTAFDMNAKVAYICESVQAWLSHNKNYETAMSVIEKGNKADIESLMLVYTQNFNG